MACSNCDHLIADNARLNLELDDCVETLKLVNSSGCQEIEDLASQLAACVQERDLVLAHDRLTTASLEAMTQERDARVLAIHHHNIVNYVNQQLAASEQRCHIFEEAFNDLQNAILDAQHLLDKEI